MERVANMSVANSESSVPGRRSLAHLGAFIFGLPLAIAILTIIFQLPEGTVVKRYVEHPVEWVEVVMFCCALGALLSKVLGQWSEKRALRLEVLPSCQGHPVPVTEAGHPGSVPRALVAACPKTHTLLT